MVQSSGSQPVVMSLLGFTDQMPYMLAIYNTIHNKQNYSYEVAIKWSGWGHFLMRNCVISVAALGRSRSTALEGARSLCLTLTFSGFVV
jgi:hypothetical protein